MSKEIAMRDLLVKYASEKHPELAEAMGREKDAGKAKPLFSLVVIDEERGEVYPFAEWEPEELSAVWVAKCVQEVQTRLGHNRIKCHFLMN